MAALALSLVTACGGAGRPGYQSDLERTWSRAFVALPPVRGGTAEFTDMGHGDAISRLAGRYPVVLYLHGCTGLGTAGRDLMKRLAGQGYVVVAPNSMARRFRPLQCDIKTRTGGNNLFVYEFRLAEVAYALDRMKSLSWPDFDNLFVVGVSEGGVAAALYRGQAFRARVILQWTCHGGTLVRGIAGPPGTPILAVVRARDPWYDAAHTPGQGGDCGSFFGDRPGSRSVVLGKGGGHDVLGLKSVVEMVAAFVARNTRRRDPLAGGARKPGESGAR